MHPLVIVEQFVFSERANDTVLNNNVELTVWDRLSQIQQLRELRQAQLAENSLCGCWGQELIGDVFLEW